MDTNADNRSFMIGSFVRMFGIAWNRMAVPFLEYDRVDILLGQLSSVHRAKEGRVKLYYYCYIVHRYYSKNRTNDVSIRSGFTDQVASQTSEGFVRPGRRVVS